MNEQGFMFYFRSIGRGIADCLFCSQYMISWKEGFNQQSFRKEIFSELCERLSPAKIVETGTFRGATTEYMYRVSRRPVYSIEFHPRYFGFALVRLFRFPRIHLSLGDSCQFLRNLSRRGWFAREIVLFYLDAHWEKYLPLREELEIIFTSSKKAIVMIDDFKVPNDEGYRFDDYGRTERLDLTYLGTVAGNEFSKFFPSASSSLETGSKRGCVILAQDRDLIYQLRSFKSLREWL